MITSQEYIHWLQGFLEALQDVSLDHEDMGIALKKIQDKLNDVVDQKQQTIITQPNGTTPYIAPHHLGTPYTNPYTINSKTNGVPSTRTITTGDPFTPNINNTNIS
jgi:hypothetical protein